MAILLVGVDFSPRSDRALRRAVLLARQFGYELRIVGVLEEDPVLTTPSAQSRQATDLLRQLARTINDVDGVKSEFELHKGKVSEHLAQTAQQSGAELLVIGPHGRSFVRDAFGAITGERIVQRSQVPVICSNGVPVGPYRRFLLPVDFSDASKQAVEAVRRLRIADEAEIVLLHIYDPEAREMLGRAMVSTSERHEYLSQCAAAAKRDLKQFAAAAGLNHVQQYVEEARGPVAAEIERIAAEIGTDVVVLSKSQKGVIAKMVLGSVTEDLVRSGKLDVLVVPEPQ